MTQPNAKVDINTSVSWKQRYNAEAFRPTRTATDNFHLGTTINDYEAALVSFTGAIYTYIQSLRASGAEIAVHIAIRVDNPTHPTPAAGVVPLAKAYRDLALTDLETTSAATISTAISDAILNLRKISKY